MDFQTENAVVAVWEDGGLCEVECPIDGDFLLPDYCPDIAAILKCTVKPAVLSRQWSGDKLLIEGQSLVRVLYLDEDRKCVRSFEAIEIALKRTTFKQNPTFEYINSIISDWHERNLQTPSEVEAFLEQRKKQEKSTKDLKAQVQKANYDQRQYDNLDFLYANPLSTQGGIVANVE